MHLSVFSPPFAELFVYSDSESDMGNSQDEAEFFEHFDYLIPELLRVTVPGRLCVVHCKQTQDLKWRDGQIGLRDFRGEIIRHFVAAGWLYHSEVCIWKDPVTEMQRTKALGLLYKQVRKDASQSRQGQPDYLLVFRKPPVPGDEALIEPVVHTEDDMPLPVWQRYASPVWFDIDQERVLNVRIAKDSRDEKHMCPLQLDVIERAILLWSNPGDVVYSPFAGVGSETSEAVRLGRRAVGCELKDVYWEWAVRNTQAAENRQASLFDLVGVG